MKKSKSTSKVGATSKVGNGCGECNISAVLLPLSIIAVTLGLFLCLPIPVTLFSFPADENLAVPGEILPQNPLVQCTDDISTFTPFRRIGIDILFATYDRVNTSRYAVQTFVYGGGVKTVLAEEIFRASEVDDNAFRRFETEVPPTTPGKLCVSLSTSDAKPGNALTVWHNGSGHPIIEISAEGTPAMMFGELAGRSDFSLGRDTLLGLFFMYLLVQVWLVFYLYANHRHATNRRPGAQATRRPGAQAKSVCETKDRQSG